MNGCLESNSFFLKLSSDSRNFLCQFFKYLSIYQINFQSVKISFYSLWNVSFCSEFILLETFFRFYICQFSIFNLSNAVTLVSVRFCKLALWSNVMSLVKRGVYYRNLVVPAYACMSVRDELKRSHASTLNITLLTNIMGPVYLNIL